MKTVTLFRHAKSGDKDNPAIKDFDRTLAERGLKAAPAMGKAMRKRRIRPDLILCSPSARTRQTLSLAQAEAWDSQPETCFDGRLYEASAGTLLAILREIPGDVSHVMIVGHNPAVQDLSTAFVPLGSETQEEYVAKFPTGAIASFEMDAERWPELQPGCGRLQHYLTPRMLQG